MNEFKSISEELVLIVQELEPRLIALPEEVLTGRRNNQGRNIKQIIGHMIDSASNNTHRIINLQYQASPLIFPDYAHFGNNDRWIAIQDYEEENWHNLVQLWKYINLHFAHVILHVNTDKLTNEWISGTQEKISLRGMVFDYPRHFKLHCGEIEELINKV